MLVIFVITSAPTVGGLGDGLEFNKVPLAKVKYDDDIGPGQWPWWPFNVKYIYIQAKLCSFGKTYMANYYGIQEYAKSTSDPHSKSTKNSTKFKFAF